MTASDLADAILDALAEMLELPPSLVLSMSPAELRLVAAATSAANAQARRDLVAARELLIERRSAP